MDPFTGLLTLESCADEANANAATTLVDDQRVFRLSSSGASSRTRDSGQAPSLLKEVWQSIYLFQSSKAGTAGLGKGNAYGIVLQTREFNSIPAAEFRLHSKRKRRAAGSLSPMRSCQMPHSSTSSSQIRLGSEIQGQRPSIAKLIHHTSFKLWSNALTH